MSIILLVGGAVVSVAVVAVALFRGRSGSSEPDLGSVSRSWTTEHNASHGKDSSSH